MEALYHPAFTRGMGEQLPRRPTGNTLRRTSAGGAKWEAGETRRKRETLSSVIERILDFFEKNSFIELEDDESVIK